MRHMTPPGQNIGGVEYLVGQTVRGLIKSGGADFKTGLTQRFGQRHMHAARIKFGDFRAGFFMTVFVPHGNAQGHDDLQKQ